MRNAQADAIKDKIIPVFSRLSSENARNVIAPSEAADVQPATRNQVLYISFHANNTCPVALEGMRPSSVAREKFVAFMKSAPELSGVLGAPSS